MTAAQRAARAKKASKAAAEARKVKAEKAKGTVRKRVASHRRDHESLNNLTPADVYFGRGQTILLARDRIKRTPIEHRRLQHRAAAA